MYKDQIRAAIKSVELGSSPEEFANAIQNKLNRPHMFEPIVEHIIVAGNLDEFDEEYSVNYIDAMFKADDDCGLFNYDEE